MTLFQYISLSSIGLALLRELFLLFRGRASWPAWPLRVVTWFGTGLAIYQPNLVQAVAQSIGIGRGADVVLYLFVLIFICASFYFYSGQVTLERRLTELLRVQAISNARRGAANYAMPAPADSFSGQGYLPNSAKG